MKTKSNLNLLLTLIFSVNFLSSFGSFKDEVQKLFRPDLLPQFCGGIVRQVSSYDTTGGNDDGFSGKYSYLRKEGNTLVIADLAGPGVIQRIWTPTPAGDTIQFYFDGEPFPRIELKFSDLFSGNTYPFLRPVVGNEVGGFYCYLPIPYNKSCKIVYKGKRMQFIQIQYREQIKAPIETFPKVFSEAEKKSLDSVISAWKKSGQNILESIPAYNNQIKTKTVNLRLKQGQTESFFNLNSGGRVVGIELKPSLPFNDVTKDIILRAFWDNEPVAAINCPVTDFFGYAFGEPSMQSLLAGVKGNLHYNYFPMPFEKNAKLELEFIKSHLNQTSEIPVEVTVYYTERPKSENEGKFYAEWKREINPAAGSPYQILKKEGRGHYVGTMLQAQGLNPGMTIFFEGDDECRIDGELRLHGTGSEDYFNGGWYALPDRWDQAFSLPTHGCLEYSIPLARTGGYRLLLTDKIPFEKSISLSIEHGPEKNLVPVDYTSVAFYYCDRPPYVNPLPEPSLLEKINHFFCRNSLFLYK
jgi:hypothetical protein